MPVLCSITSQHMFYHPCPVRAYLLHLHQVMYLKSQQSFPSGGAIACTGCQAPPVPCRHPHPPPLPPPLAVLMRPAP